MMRTTISLPDDVYEAAKALAHYQDISIGNALAELVRRGMRPAMEIEDAKAFPCFKEEAGVPLITSTRIRELEDEL